MSIILKYIPDDAIIKFNLGWGDKAVPPVDEEEEKALAIVHKKEQEEDDAKKG